MNDNSSPQIVQQPAEVERGAAVAADQHTASTTTSITRNNSKMKVSDRIQAMNKIIDHELEEPIEFGGDTKSSVSTSSGNNYPKRSSVVEMWKKREASIKSSSSANIFKFEEKKEAHSQEEDESASGSDRDARQQDRVTSSANNSDVLPGVTPERSGPESDNDSSNNNNNFGSHSSGSVRRSTVRDAWKKRTPATVSSFTPQSKSTSAHFAVVTPDTTTCSDHNRSSSESSAHDPTPVVPASPSASRDTVRKTWRKMKHSPKPQYTAPASPAMKPTSTYIERTQSRDSAVSETHSNAGSSTAFDELRSKWAKFGVQKVQAREHSQVKPVAPPSPGAHASSLSARAPSTPVSQKAVPASEQPTNSLAVPTEHAQGTENPAPGGRKSQLVKMGQLHAHRPNKVESSPARAKSPIKRHNATKYSPKRSAGTASGTTMTPKQFQSTNHEADWSPKRNSVQKSADSRILLKAKHRRRAQLAQPSTAAAMSQKNVQRSFSSQDTMPKDSSEESFPLDEKDPGAFGQRTRTVHNNSIRTTLPMRTLFGSQSGESLNLGAGSSIYSDPTFPEPIQMTSTDVMKTSFDSWSNMDSLQEQDLQDPSLDSFAKEYPREMHAKSDAAHVKPSNSITNSALKRLREKRQKHFSPKVDASYQQKAWEEPSTPRTAAETPMSASTSRNAFSTRPNYTPASPDPSSAISTSMCSGSTLSTSQVHSVNASGMTNESDLHQQLKMAQLKSSFKDVVPDADKMVPDQFVSESNANVQSFQAAYETMSLEQIANDMKEEASSALSIDFLSNDLLNKSMHAAGASLNKLVAGEMFKKQRQLQHKPARRAASPIEEVAIEVEYIADDDVH